MIPEKTDCYYEVLCKYDHVMFGALWSLALTLNCFALTVATLLLGYMLAVPDVRVYHWATKQADMQYLGIPALLTVLGTFYNSFF
jgi:hypothetical protein